MMNRNDTVTVCGRTWTLIRLLGQGKGGYSWLAESKEEKAVVKQIHHLPCDYYTFGDKIVSEREDYLRLKQTGIRIPEMIDIDMEAERIVKEYIDGPTVMELVKNGITAEPYFDQVREMASLAKACGLNIDYFPTNFVVRDQLLWYIDYECNPYMDQWNFENWGILYWTSTPELKAYLASHP